LLLGVRQAIVGGLRFSTCGWIRLLQTRWPAQVTRPASAGVSCRHYCARGARRPEAPLITRETKTARLLFNPARRSTRGAASDAVPALVARKNASVPGRGDRCGSLVAASCVGNRTAALLPFATTLRGRHPERIAARRARPSGS
jgi:hypothetical protein